MKNSQVIFIAIAIVFIFMSGYLTHYLIYSSKNIDSTVLAHDNELLKKEIEKLRKDSAEIEQQVEDLNSALADSYRDTLPIHNDHEKDIANIINLNADRNVELLAKHLSEKNHH